MGKKKLKKISGGVLLAIGLLTYSVHYFSPYFMETEPEWLPIVCMFVFGVCGGLGLLLMFMKKEDELDTDLKKTMDEKRYYRN